MTTDPAPFLSTLVAASATLAAIIGGLLVARFVSLDSDQRVSRKVLADARGRLEAAVGRSKAAARDVVAFDAGAFMESGDVLAAIGRGVTTAGILMRGGRWEHGEADLEKVAAEVAEEFARARAELGERGLHSQSDWQRFQRMTADLPEMRWPRVWERVHDEFAEKAAEEEDSWLRTEGRPGIVDVPFSMSAIGRRRMSEMTRKVAPQPDRSAIDARRRDDLVARRERAAQQAEDCESELRRLELDHHEIARPDSRLWWGIGIVIAFVITGVALPLWAMSQGVKSLVTVQWMFWPFTAALTLLVIYIVAYLAQLTRRKLRRKRCLTCGSSHAVAAVGHPRGPTLHGYLR